MAAKNFVLIIEKGTPWHIVERIGKGVAALQGQGIEPSVRTMDAILEDVRKGIPDDLLLKTELPPDEIQQLLAAKLGHDYGVCQLKWV